MFVGHYAAAMAAKAIELKAPMWTLAAAAQLIGDLNGSMQHIG